MVRGWRARLCAAARASGARAVARRRSDHLARMPLGQGEAELASRHCLVALADVGHRSLAIEYGLVHWDRAIALARFEQHVGCREHEARFSRLQEASLQEPFRRTLHIASGVCRQALAMEGGGVLHGLFVEQLL